MKKNIYGEIFHRLSSGLYSILATILPIFRQNFVQFREKMVEILKFYLFFQKKGI